MFITKQGQSSIDAYKKYLKCMGMLSRLSSESSIPYIGYREAENILCMVFGANNLSRSDCSADASKDGIGIGVKTFLNGNGKTLQKIAEFNKDSKNFRDLMPKEMIYQVAELRNERLRSTKRIHGLTQLVYHCVVRDEKKIKVFECSMDEINIDKIKNVTLSNNSNTITFEDGLNQYSFNVSKSTLYKRFITENVALEIEVEIIENPYKILADLLLADTSKLVFSSVKQDRDYVILPLFSDQGGRHVPPKSGLNQWNASGRRRNVNEIYIPIPLWIHKVFPSFFPDRDTPFELLLPDGRTLSSKVCQQGGKALMSNPNLDLGKWLLRDVMALAEGELLEYRKLETLGLDSVIIYKNSSNNYSIDFRPLGSYDEFVENYKNKKTT